MVGSNSLCYTVARDSFAGGLLPNRTAGNRTSTEEACTLAESIEGRKWHGKTRLFDRDGLAEEVGRPSKIRTCAHDAPYLSLDKL